MGVDSFGRIIRMMVVACGLAGLSAAAAAAFELELRVADDDVLEAKMRRALSLSELADDPRATADDVLAAAQADYRRALAELYDQGYFAPQVSIRLDGREAAGFSPFEGLARVARVIVTVRPGKRFHFGRATLAPMPGRAKAPPRFSPGEIATLGRMRRAAEAGVEAWRQAGHAKATLDRQKITANEAQAIINADLHLAPGPRLTFGRLRFRGLDRLRPERAQAIAGLPRGAVFDPDDVETAAARLRRTGVFRSVSMEEADDIGPGQTLDIIASVEESAPRRIGFGAEISTLEGATLSGFWLHRNLLGGAERFRVEAEISDIARETDAIDYRLGFSLSRPATGHPDQSLELGLDLASVVDPAYSEDRIAARVGLNRRVNDQLTLSVGAVIARLRTRDAFGRRDFLLLSLPVEAELDRRDDPLNPTGGFYLKAGVMPFVGNRQTGAGLRLDADARAYRALDAEGRLVLAGRLVMGSVIGPALADTPPDLLYFSGGGGTVRGHGFQSLGIAQAGGLSGGRSLLVASGELRSRLRDRLSLVGFYDAGFVGADAMPGRDAQWHAGAGFGVRFDTGLGPVRLDVATPVTGTRAWRRVELYVGIGQAF